jgi:hypothetical protein
MILQQKIEKFASSAKFHEATAGKLAGGKARCGIYWPPTRRLGAAKFSVNSHIYIYISNSKCKYKIIKEKIKVPTSVPTRFVTGLQTGTRRASGHNPIGRISNRHNPWSVRGGRYFSARWVTRP